MVRSWHVRLVPLAPAPFHSPMRGHSGHRCNAKHYAASNFSISLRISGSSAAEGFSAHHDAFGASKLIGQRFQAPPSHCILSSEELDAFCRPAGSCGKPPATW